MALPFIPSDAALLALQAGVVAAPRPVRRPVWMARCGSGGRRPGRARSSVVIFAIRFLSDTAIGAERSGTGGGASAGRSGARMGRARRGSGCRHRRSGAVRGGLGGSQDAGRRGGGGAPLGAQLRHPGRAARLGHAATLAEAGDPRDGGRRYLARGLRPAPGAERHARRRPSARVGCHGFRARSSAR